MKIYNDWYRAFVIHSKKQTETSLLVTFFIEEIGIVKSVMKGALRKNNPVKGILQNFMLLRVKLVKKSDMIFVTNVEQEALTINLKELYFYSAIYINELIYKILKPGIAHDDIFLLYIQTLLSLHNQQSLEILLRKFELSFIKHLGYYPDFNYSMESACNINYEQNFYYTHEMGFVRLDPDDAIYHKKNTIFNGLVLQRIDNQEFSDPDVLKNTKFLCRIIIDNMVGFKEIKSRSLIMDFIRLKKLHNK